jgi:hypothetical protein
MVSFLGLGAPVGHHQGKDASEERRMLLCWTTSFQDMPGGPRLAGLSPFSNWHEKQG